MRLEEKWYEGDFKEKYPNGVWCWAWNYNRKPQRFVKIVDYDIRVQYYPFIDREGGNWTDAEPITKEEIIKIYNEVKACKCVTKIYENENGIDNIDEEFNEKSNGFYVTPNGIV